MDSISTYLADVEKKYKTGIAREHAFRGDLEQLLRTLLPDVDVINEPSEVADCGNPDFVITQKDIPLGFIEAKDIGKNLNAKQYKEQFDRYRKALPNLIITDYLYFQFFEEGQQVFEVNLAVAEGGRITPQPDNFETFQTALKAFRDYSTDTIRSPSRLAQMMADRARLLENILAKALESDDNNKNDTELKAQYVTFKNLLIHDMTPRQFADIYAQTLAYGLFAARLHDETLEDFSRSEAATLIPKSNPFLRRLFQYIAGPDIDSRILPIFEHLVTIFRHTNVRDLLKNFGISTARNDPIIHFYETFLAAYDPKLRKARGVYYTPEPVVDFIVRAVNDLLVNKFDLADGLADTSKTTVTIDIPLVKGRGATRGTRIVTTEEEVHKVQILDPATGTGTFLAQIIKVIYENNFKDVAGAWPGYVQQELIPRLHGFEFLMAPYAMAHLKLDLLLRQTGYKPSDANNPPRLNIYLTNSLEPYHPDSGTLFAQWLSHESEEANRVKRDVPVMVAIGNPPYSGHSANKGEWIADLLGDYKKEPGGGRLQEKNSKWLNDDYVKFIRYGQHYVQKNGKGILAYINNNGFLDNPTFRGMRWDLLQCFDEMYILDLHGNSNKKETAPDGSADINVFDIQPGVSINLFVKTGEKKNGALAKLYHQDVFGKRADKYDFLWHNSIDSTKWQVLNPAAPKYFFVSRDTKLESEFQSGFSVQELFPIHGNGVVTKRDKLCIQPSKQKCLESATDILNLEKAAFYRKYELPKDVRDWKYDWAKKDVLDDGAKAESCQKINYRPFDQRYIYYTGCSRGFVGWPVEKVMKNYINGPNFGLLTTKAYTDKQFNHVFITNSISEAIFLSSVTGSNAMNFPLYLYADKGVDPEVNFNSSIIENIETHLGIKLVTGEKLEDGFYPLDLLDYIYAVLHSSEYRDRYKVFLRSDFPHIPYPPDKEDFWALVELGRALRSVHLLEASEVDDFVSSYPQSRDNVIRRGAGKNDFEVAGSDPSIGRVWINDEQYFEGVPVTAWEFFIGGYQPAQKWLKDRKGNTLTYEDIRHYQRIIKSLVLTNELIGKIAKIKFLP